MIVCVKASTYRYVGIANRQGTKVYLVGLIDYYRADTLVDYARQLIVQKSVVDPNWWVAGAWSSISPNSITKIYWKGESNG